MKKIIKKIQDTAFEIRVLQDRLEKQKRSLIKELIKWRNEQGVSGRQMAEKLGISAQYMCDLELGRRKVSEQILEKISNF